MNLNTELYYSDQQKAEVLTSDRLSKLVHLDRYSSKIRKTHIDKPKFDLDFQGKGVENALGRRANNVEKLSRDGLKGSTLSPIKLRNHKPLRYLNHEIKRNLASLRISEPRTIGCGCRTIGGNVILSIDTRHGNARASGVETCGSVWACPVCREKIMSERSNELKAIGEAWTKQGGKTTLLTLTFSHNYQDDLSKLLGHSDRREGLKGAVRRFRQSHYWRALKDTIGYEADCRSLEITWGNNGFHPHIHMLIYHTKGTTKAQLKAIKTDLYKNWRDCCIDSGLEAPNFENGLDIRPAVSRDYIAKWGMVQELASPHRKKGAQKSSMTIPEMEYKVLELPLQDPRNQRIQGLLYNYYRILKGSKLLTWGGQKKGEPSFKKRMIGEEEKTDEELATIQVKELIHLWAMVEIPSSQWQSIYWRGHTADIRTVLEKGGLSLLKKWGKTLGYDVSAWKPLPDDYYQSLAEEKGYCSFQYRQ